MQLINWGYVVDKTGRKTLLLVGTQIMTFALLLLSVILIAANQSPSVQVHAVIRSIYSLPLPCPDLLLLWLFFHVTKIGTNCSACGIVLYHWICIWIGSRWTCYIWSCPLLYLLFFLLLPPPSFSNFIYLLFSVNWVVLSEIMSTRMRTKAFSLFVSINWGVNLVIGLLTLPGKHAVKSNQITT